MFTSVLKARSIRLVKWRTALLRPKYVLCTALFVHVCLLGISAFLHGPGWDEIGHLPAGLSYWRSNNTDMYRVNPPLARAFATAVLAPLRLNVRDVECPEGTLDRPEFVSGRIFWREHGERANLYLFVCRLASIPWSLISAFGIFCAARKLHGERAAALVVILWSFSPLVIANAQLMTPDTCAAACSVLAVIAFDRWLESKNYKNTFLLGITTGGALLAKLTLLVLPLLFIGCMIFSRIFVNKRYHKTKWIIEFMQLLLAMAVALSLVNVFYGLNGTGRTLSSYSFVSATLKGYSGGGPGNRFQASLVGELPIPLPSNLVLGIDRQKYDFEVTMPSFLAGEWRDGGWIHYYIYGMLVKEPIGFLLIAGVAAIFYVKKGPTFQELLFLVPGVTIFVLVSSQTGFNHHLRYVLPSIPFFLISVARVWQKSSRLKTTFVVLLTAWGIVSSLRSYPHSHAHFNALAGGPLNGHKHLLNSNLDWGQDLIALAKWADNNPQVELKGVAFTLHHLLSPSSLGLPEATPPTGSPVTAFKGSGPQPGAYAVFASELFRRDKKYEYFLDFEPIEIIGYTVYVYDLNETEVQQYWRRRLRHVAIDTLETEKDSLGTSIGRSATRDVLSIGGDESSVPLTANPEE